MTITLNGRNLRIAEVYSIISNPKVKIELDPRAVAVARKSEKFLTENIKGKIVYGINTGFGPMASHILADDQLVMLQENLIRSHAVGMGEPIDQKFVLAAMVIRLNTLLRGFSGVSENLLRQLEFFINKRITPIVYEHGAVGTSGDLVQLAHIALALIGEGEVYFNGEKFPAAEVLKNLGRSGHKLQAKEGLALINGTAMMTAVSSLVLHDAQRLLNLAVLDGGLALELIEAYEDGISPMLQSVRPHPGQVAVAAQLRKILAKSKLLKHRSSLKHNVKILDKVHRIAESVQEVYSFRCIPQILGPVHDSLKSAISVVETEMNSVTDNPIVDVANGQFLHGGNFHGDYVATAMDQLKITLVKMTMLSERRTNFFLNEKINMRFPPFLNLNKPGLTLALQALQFVTTSTTAQNQSLAFPHSVHSISTNADNQDVVSMGTDAALMAYKVIENAYIVLGIELLTLCQAVDLLKNRGKLSRNTAAVYDALRAVFPVIHQDRVMIDQLKEVIELLKSTRTVELAWD